MSQAVAALSRNLIPFIICITLAACNGSYSAFESDQDFNTDQKTADIEKENAELMALAAFQAAFLGHYQSAAFLFLDASDLPDDDMLTEVTNQYQCDNFKAADVDAGVDVDGIASYTYTQNSGEEHKAGDRITASYKNCKKGDLTYNGSMKATYSKLKGLNNRFVDITTSECVANLTTELSAKDENIIYVTADELKFTNVSDELKVDLILVDSSSDEDVVKYVKDTLFVRKDVNAIIVHQPITLPVNAVTSIDGDQVYSIEAAISKKRLCQSFERTLSVQFENFSTDKMDYLFTSLNGSVTLLDAQETSNRVTQAFIDSSFQTTVRQGKATSYFNMKNYRAEKAANISNKTYSYQFEGFISNSNIFGGQIELTKTLKISGSSQNNYPHLGSFELKGQGLERVRLVPTNLKVELQVDFNGDSTGNGFSDLDIVIPTTWAELFARDFRES